MALLAAGFPPSIICTPGADVYNLLVELRAAGFPLATIDVHSFPVGPHVEARELAAYVRVPAPLDVASAVVASSPLRESEAKRARSLEPRPVYVESYLASVPEGLPCVLGLEPEVARMRGSVLGRSYFGLYPCPVCTSPLPAHARVCY